MSELFPIRTIAIEVFRGKGVFNASQMNHWYDKVYIPKARLIQGVASVSRYISRDYDYGEYTPDFFESLRKESERYLTIYSILTNDPEEVLKEIKKLSAEKPEYIETLDISLWDFKCMRQRTQPLLKQPQTRLADGMPEMFMLIPNINYEKDLPELDDWWLYTHAHDIMEIPGYVQASRYHNITPEREEGAPLALNIYEIDSDDPLQHPLMENIIGDIGRAKEGRMLDVSQLASKKTYLIGAFQHWDIMSAI